MEVHIEMEVEIRRVRYLGSLAMDVAIMLVYKEGVQIAKRAILVQKVREDPSSKGTKQVVSLG